MKILFCALNSKYIHSTLAPWYLSASVERVDGVFSSVFEGTINEKIEDLYEKIKAYEFDVIGFSTYIWNKNYVLQLAKIIKLKLNKKVILGGPEVSYNAKEILSENNFVDAVISGEGEEPFYQLAGGKNYEEISGFCYRKNGEIVVKEPHISVSDPPFPYTQKYLDSLVGRIAYLETSRGCPFRCAFCLSGRQGGVRFFDLEQSKRKILLLANSGTQTVKFIDRTFNADKKRAREIFDFIIKKYGEEIPKNVCFHFEIEANLIDEETLEILEKAPVGLFQFEIGLQSFNEKTLQYIYRRSDLGKTVSAIEKIISLGNIHVHIDLIAGLSYETLESFENGFNRALALRPNMLQLGFLKMLHGAEMREDKKRFEAEYEGEPPYEIISTKWLTKEEIKTLHMLEDVFEKLYNSGRFRRTCEYVFSLVENPFREMIKFAEYCKENLKNNTLDDFTEAVYNYFLGVDGVNKNVLRDMLALDRLSTNKMGVLPEFLKVHSPLIKKILNELERDKETRREKNVKRAATLLLSRPAFVYVDYKNLHKVEKNYKVREIYMNMDEK